MYTVQSYFFPPQSSWFPVWGGTAYSQELFFNFLSWFRLFVSDVIDSRGYRLSGVSVLRVNSTVLHTTRQLFPADVRRTKATETFLASRDQQLLGCFVFMRSCLCVQKGKPSLCCVALLSDMLVGASLCVSVLSERCCIRIPAEIWSLQLKKIK